MSDLFNAIFGGPFGFALKPEDMRPMTEEQMASLQRWHAQAQLNAFNDPEFQARLSMSTAVYRAVRKPGIYWTRTGGKSHRVEIVR